jgi:hypothetical protein
MNNLQRIEINGCFISPFRSLNDAYLHNDVMEMVVRVLCANIGLSGNMIGLLTIARPHYTPSA